MYIDIGSSWNARLRAAAASANAGSVNARGGESWRPGIPDIMPDSAPDSPSANANEWPFSTKKADIRYRRSPDEFGRFIIGTPQRNPEKTPCLP
ncbi:MAG: hypothetical protein ACR2QV_14130, partial [Gammaproteobacteria bacterium]